MNQQYMFHMFYNISPSLHLFTNCSSFTIFLHETFNYLPWAAQLLAQESLIDMVKIFNNLKFGKKVYY